MGPFGKPRKGALDLAGEAVEYAKTLLDERGEIASSNGELRAGDTLLDGDTDVVDAVQSKLGFGCTLFHGNRRVATTAVAAGSTERAIGTVANEMITASVLGAGRRFSGVTRTIGKDWVIVYAPLHDATGTVVGMVAAFRDVMHFIEDFYQLDDIPEALVLHDEDGFVLGANLSACHMMALSRTDLLGCELAELFDAPAGALEAAWAAAADEHIVVEGSLGRPDGSVLPVKLAVGRIEGQQELLTVVSAL